MRETVCGPSPPSPSPLNAISALNKKYIPRFSFLYHKAREFGFVSTKIYFFHTYLYFLILFYSSQLQYHVYVFFIPVFFWFLHHKCHPALVIFTNASIALDFFIFYAIRQFAFSRDFV